MSELQQCPNGCTSPFYLVTTVRHRSSDGTDESWCGVCGFRWDNSQGGLTGWQSQFDCSDPQRSRPRSAPDRLA